MVDLEGRVYGMTPKVGTQGGAGILLEDFNNCLVARHIGVKFTFK